MAQSSKLRAQSGPIKQKRRLNETLAALVAHRRDAILEAVAASAKELLRSANTEQSLSKVIECIGQATGVDRVHILKLDPAAPERGNVLQHDVWTAPGISTPPHFNHAAGTAMIDVGLQSWLRRLAAGDVIVGHTRDFEAGVRAFFTSADVKSAMAVPVFADGRLWGHIGFDDCRDEREWAATEIDTLKTLAELIGAAVSARRYEAILEAVAMSAQELLRSSDLAKSLPWVIERIGQATGVGWAHIIELQAPSAYSPVVEHYVWKAPGVSSAINYEQIKAPMADLGLQAWVPRLIRGETIVGNTRDLEPAARAQFEKGNIKSLMAVPVFVDGQWWGLIGFAECGLEREWTSAEIETFKTLAELIGAAVARTRHLRTLADANRIVENSTTILYRLDLKPQFPLIFVSQNINRYGYEATELLAHPTRWAQLIDPADLSAMLDDLRSIGKGQTDLSQREFRWRRPDGSIVWFDGHGRAIRDNNNRLVAVEGILTDITERKLAAEKIAALARTDSLTGLANRTAFLERLNLDSPAPSAALSNLPCIISTSIISRTSTTRWGIPTAMPCFARSPNGSRAACATPTWWRASAATSSPCCRTISKIPPMSRHWRRRSAKSSPFPSPSTAIRCIRPQASASSPTAATLPPSTP